MVDAGLDAVIVNPTAIFGPIDVGPSRVNRVLRLAARGRVPFVVGGGFDFVDVRDVVVGLVAAARHGRTGESYLLGGHRETALGLARRAADRGSSRASLGNTAATYCAVRPPRRARRSDIRIRLVHKGLGVDTRRGSGRRRK